MACRRNSGIVLGLGNGQILILEQEKDVALVAASEVRSVLIADGGGFPLGVYLRGIRNSWALLRCSNRVAARTFSAFLGEGMMALDGLYMHMCVYVHQSMYINFVRAFLVLYVA